jgi:hypothetical protein
MLLDTISQAGRVDLSSIQGWSEKQLEEHLLDWWNECAAMHMLLPSQYMTGEARNEALMQTLVSAVDFKNERPSHTHAFQSYYQFQQCVHQRCNGLLIPKAMTSEWNEMSSFAVVNTTLGRVFFITQRGLMSLAPYSVHPGDEVAVMLGCDVPLMLRRQGYGIDGPEFHLLGECYLHGIMFSEAIRDQSLPVTNAILR